MVSPVAVLIFAKVLPETLSRHLPPMSSGWSLTRGGFIVRGLLGAAVAMRRPPSTGEGTGTDPSRLGRPAELSHRVMACVKDLAFGCCSVRWNFACCAASQIGRMVQVRSAVQRSGHC